MNKTKISRTIIMIVIAWLSMLFLCSEVMPVALPAFAETATESVTEYPMPSDTVVLTKGAKSEDVKWLQSALNTVMNVNLTVDGNFGGNTETVLMEFQKSKGIDANGKADSATINALAEAAGQRTTTVTTQTVTNLTTSDENEESGHAFKDYWKTYFENANKLVFHFSEAYGDLKFYLGGLGSAFIMCLTVGIGAAFCIVVILTIIGVKTDLVSIIAKIAIISAILIFLIPCFVDMYYINDRFAISGFRLIGIELLYLLLRLLIGAFIAAAIAFIFVTIITAISFVLKNNADTVTPIEAFKDTILLKPVLIVEITVSVFIILIMYVVPIFMQIS